MKLFFRRREPSPASPEFHFAVPQEVPRALVPIGEELSRLEESSRWSSQCQFEQGKFWRGCNLTIGIPASVLGLASGGAGIADALPAQWIGWAALVAAALTGIMTVLTADRRAQSAQSCANAFHDIQEDARRMLLVDLALMDAKAAREGLRELNARYSEIRHTADAPASRFYEKARKNIQSGGQMHAIDAAPAIPTSGGTRNA